MLKNVFQASKYKAAIFPVAGTLIGTALGGPVGLAVGVKVGAMAENINLLILTVR